MIFTSFDYIIFLTVVFTLYWLIRDRRSQNFLLLVSSYYFYGYIHPAFCFLIAGLTIVNFLCGLGMGRYHDKRKVFLLISLVTSLGVLGFFKYFNFFIDNVSLVLTSIGLDSSPSGLAIFLPVGISFYTFQTLSYTIDIYRKELVPRTNFLDFALFVSLFPQLVAGPIERAKRLLPQIEAARKWSSSFFISAWPLLVRGFFKKMVIADNIAVYVNKVYMLEQPSLLLLIVGTLGFTLQIYADFSAYTDIARGTGRLLGFDLIKNFNSPYLAITPSDFWRRWHISFSTWIRDYLYIPMGGSRVRTKTQFFFVIMTSMGLCGLWHGAAWTFVAWGLFHGLLIVIYRSLGIAGNWVPKAKSSKIAAWVIMFFLICVGWCLFRASSLSWLFGIFGDGFSFGSSGDSFVASVVIFFYVIFYTLPLALFFFLDRLIPAKNYIHAAFYSLCLVSILIFFRGSGQDFIYFQF